mmetsp:Transcript_56878/g.166540  ORF Transcript_56878/g.166540 Transcript_56878/m.166540 type:complete len:209 (+) Transcript_56878:237-863(+)
MRQAIGELVVLLQEEVSPASPEPQVFELLSVPKKPRVVDPRQLVQAVCAHARWQNKFVCRPPCTFHDVHVMLRAFETSKSAKPFKRSFGAKESKQRNANPHASIRHHHQPNVDPVNPPALKLPGKSQISARTEIGGSATKQHQEASHNKNEGCKCEVVKASASKRSLQSIAIAGSVVIIDRHRMTQSVVTRRLIKVEQTLQPFSICSE